MRSSVAGRIAAIGAVVAAIVIVAILLFSGGGGGYTVHARFLNAAQLVKGDQVEIGGVKVGSIDSLSLTPDGQADVTLSIDSDYKPLRKGTKATIRQASLSGIANRYVDLTLPPGDARTTGTMESGSTIYADNTTTAVDLDQLFNAIDPKTQKSLQAFFKGSAAQFKGKEKQQQLAYHYLNPALSTSSRLFNELNRDQPLLERFLVDSSSLVTNIADRRDDLSALVQNLNGTFTALGNEHVALADSINRLPGFMRQANTTFVDLRSTLDSVDPLVNASKPVAKKLQPLLAELRPFAQGARPTVRDLSQIVFRPGPNNDLYNLQQSFPAVAQEALDTKNRRVNFGGGSKSVGKVRGAFPEIADASIASAPIMAQGRPYTPDLMGWFDDFSTTGAYDAAGGFSRIFSTFNAFDGTGPVPSPIPLSDVAAKNSSLARTKQYFRCPGAAEVPAPDKSNVLSGDEQKALDCRDSDRASGNYDHGGPQN
jgi:phospholipid/cholesterol/gamma-HCH transport system substrate-binding protein